MLPPSSTTIELSLRSRAARVLEVFGAFLKLGFTSFGGPVAHLGFFRDEFVGRRKWLDEATYADLVALCQFLPGPASSKVGMALGTLRAGLPGAVAAWIAFSAPAAIVLILFAYGVQTWSGFADAGVLHGLKVAAVAVVAFAVWSMARTLCPDRPRATLALISAALLLIWPNAIAQILVLMAAGVVGRIIVPGASNIGGAVHAFGIRRATAVWAWVLLAALLVALPALATASSSEWLALFDVFYRVGALVFGGGHVVLPLLQAEVVPRGWVGNDEFLAGYGAAQAVPGPLFTFAAYLGAVMEVGPGGWAGGLLCVTAIFLPSFLLVVGALPFWERLRASQGAQSTLAGVNAAVVGLLLAALYDPVWTSAIHSARDLALALGAVLLLAVWRMSPWLVVVLIAATGAIVSML